MNGVRAVNRADFVEILPAGFEAVIGVRAGDGRDCGHWQERAAGLIGAIDAKALTWAGIGPSEARPVVARGLFCDQGCARREKRTATIAVTMHVAAMGGPRDEVRSRRSKVLHIDLTEQRAIDHIEAANALDVGQGGNMFDAAHDRDGLLERAVERVDEEIPDGGADGRIVSADDNFLRAIAIHITHDGRRRDKGIKILGPTRPVHKFHAVPIAEGDFVRMIEAEDVNMVVVVGIDGDEAGAIEPAKIVCDVHMRQPATPQNRAVVIQNGFVGLPKRTQLRAANEAFIEAVAIEVGGINVNGPLIGTGHHSRGFAELLVQLSFAP